jgi:seryl-tRNA synthetase
VTVQSKIAPAGDAAQISALKAQLFFETGVDGVYARTGLYEGVVEALAALISAHRPRGAEVMRFPPVMSRAQIERHGYLKSFPNLLGAVSCICGDERHIRGVVNRFIEDGTPWTDELQAADLVLAPAACYPVYPLAASRGVVPADGYVFDVAADCFRREPSTDIDRFQSFRMRE